MTLQRDSELEAQLAKALGETLRGEVRAFERVGSTMDLAHALAAQGAAEGTLVWAERQTQGRGRLGRVWESPAGGVYCSLIVRPQRPATEVPQLSLLMGLSAVEAIRECANLSPRVRWPNDVLIGGKKIAGILTEAKDGTVVIGIGINVTTKLSDLPATATSLLEPRGGVPRGDIPSDGERIPSEAVGRVEGESNQSRGTVDPYHLTARLYRRFFRWYDVWAQQGFLPVREALRPHMALFGEIVHIRAGSEEFEGTATDLDDSGRLLVRLDSGLMRAFDMGEVTLLI